MDATLDELIERKRFASRGPRQDAGAGQCWNFQSAVSPVRSGRPTRRDTTAAARRSNGYSPYSKGALSASSTRDLYEGPEQREQINGCLSSTTMHKIEISNLDYGITSRDIQKLLCDFWPLKIANVLYDSSGKSMGIAEVEFNSKSDALKAISLYNNVPLAGRRMKIETVLDFSSVSNLTRHSIPALMPVRGNRDSGGEFQGNRDYTRGFISENFGRRGGRGRTSMEQRIPNRDELDEQLDEFMQNQNN